jgi:tripartite-type tricarboxylate transporter receptor subunit TctC
MVRDGQLKAFAVTQRSNLLPDVPTFASLGVAGFDAVFWYGMVAPAGLPRAIADRIQQALAAHFLTDAGRAEMRASDIEPVMSRPAEFAASIAADSARWRELAQRLNIRPE